MVVASPNISLSTKALLGISLASWLTVPLSTANVFLVSAFPFSMGALIDAALGFVGSVPLFMYAFGYFKQHHVHR